jgi:hypothetical protein
VSGVAGSDTNVGSGAVEVTVAPTGEPSPEPTAQPTSAPLPEAAPSPTPTYQPTSEPTRQPVFVTLMPTLQPTLQPQSQPPTEQPTSHPSAAPSAPALVHAPASAAPSAASNATGSSLQPSSSPSLLTTANTNIDTSNTNTTAAPPLPVELLPSSQPSLAPFALVHDDLFTPAMPLAGDDFLHNTSVISSADPATPSASAVGSIVALAMTQVAGAGAGDAAWPGDEHESLPPTVGPASLPAAAAALLSAEGGASPTTLTAALSLAEKRHVRTRAGKAG